MLGFLPAAAPPPAGCAEAQDVNISAVETMSALETTSAVRPPFNIVRFIDVPFVS
jgi:hypothetical protein